MTLDMDMGKLHGRMALDILDTTEKIRDIMFRDKWTLEMVENIQEIGIRICYMVWDNLNTQKVAYSKESSKWESAKTTELSSTKMDKYTKDNYKEITPTVKENFFSQMVRNTQVISSKSNAMEMESKHIKMETTTSASGNMVLNMGMV